MRLPTFDGVYDGFIKCLLVMAQLGLPAGAVWHVWHCVLEIYPPEKIPDYVIYCVLRPFGFANVPAPELSSMKSLLVSASLIGAVITYAILLTIHCVGRLMTIRIANRRVELSALPSLSDELDGAVALQWQYERDLASGTYDLRLRMIFHLFGLFAAAVLGVCLVIVLTCVWMVAIGQSLSVLGSTFSGAIAMCVASAAITSLTVSIARIVIRVANHDATMRAFSYAMRSFLISIMGAALLAYFIDATTESLYKNLAIGMAAALISERLWPLLYSRAAHLLGAEPLERSRSLPLTRIEGIGVNEVQGLGERDIDSVHALAYAPVPRVFFHSSLPLARVVDLQDQALLFTLVGEGQAELLRSRHCVRGVLALVSLLDDEEAAKVLYQTLGLSSHSEVQRLRNRLKEALQVQLLGAYARTTPSVADDSAAGRRETALARLQPGISTSTP